MNFVFVFFFEWMNEWNIQKREAAVCILYTYFFSDQSRKFIWFDLYTYKGKEAKILYARDGMHMPKSAAWEVVTMKGRPIIKEWCARRIGFCLVIFYAFCCFIVCTLVMVYHYDKKKLYLLIFYFLFMSL